MSPRFGQEYFLERIFSLQPRKRDSRRFRLKRQTLEKQRCQGLQVTVVERVA